MTEIKRKTFPDSWQWIQLEELALKQRGAFVNGPFGSDLLTSELVAEGVPVIYVRDIRDGIYERVSQVCVTAQKAKELEFCQIQPGDVLIAKVGDPPGIAAIYPKNQPMGVVTQDVIKIRTNPKVITAEYLVYFLNSAQGHSFLKPIIVEGTRARFGLTPLKQIHIPVPPLAEQKRIAAIAQKADRLRRTRRYALQLSDTYLRSVFLEMFGDPATNPKGWEIVKLSSLGELDRGRSKHRPRNAPELFGGTYPFIQTGDVANSAGYVRTYKQTYSELGLKQSKLWTQGTLCITIAANIAKTGILTFDACFPDSIVGFYPTDKTNTEFIQQWFNFIQQNLEETAPESAQKNINLEILRNLNLPLPQKLLQEKFAQIVQKFERLRTQQREADRQAEHLFQTILHRAFRGELTSQNADDERESVLLEDISPQQAKAKAKAKAATQAMGDAAEYLD